MKTNVRIANDAQIVVIRKLQSESALIKEESDLNLAWQANGFVWEETARTRHFEVSELLFNERREQGWAWGSDGKLRVFIDGPLVSIK